MTTRVLIGCALASVLTLGTAASASAERTGAHGVGHREVRLTLDSRTGAIVSLATTWPRGLAITLDSRTGAVRSIRYR